MGAAFFGARARSDRDPRDSVRRIMTYFVIILIIFMLTNNVFSTHYIMWLYPFLPFLAAAEGKLNRSIAVLSLLTMLLSVLILHSWIGAHLFVIMNLARNAALIGILIAAYASSLGGKGADAEPHVSTDPDRA